MITYIIDYYYYPPSQIAFLVLPVILGSGTIAGEVFNNKGGSASGDTKTLLVPL
jgi:hypothetical protein